MLGKLWNAVMACALAILIVCLIQLAIIEHRFLNYAKAPGHHAVDAVTYHLKGRIIYISETEQMEASWAERGFVLSWVVCMAGALHRRLSGRK